MPKRMVVMHQSQIFGISQQSAVGSGKRVVRSGVEIQDVTEGEEEKLVVLILVMKRLLNHSQSRTHCIIGTKVKPRETVIPMS